MAKKMIIASGKGGVGKSSITVNLGRALTELGKTVLLIDTDISLRSLDLMLGVSENVVFDWGDVLACRCDIDAALVKARNMTLLPAPREFEEYITKDNFASLISSLNGLFDYILIDAPAGVGYGFYISAAVADEGILVSTPDNICVRSAYIAGNKLFEIGIKNVFLVINRFNRKAVGQNQLLNIDEVIDSTMVQLLGVVDEDENIIYSSVTGEELPRRSLASKDIFRIARRISGEKVPLFKNKR